MGWRPRAPSPRRRRMAAAASPWPWPRRPASGGKPCWRPAGGAATPTPPPPSTTCPAAGSAGPGQRRALLYDREGDVHYDTISAFIKSLRGSDPDAAVYWLARMLATGEDPRFIARRLGR